VASTRIAQLIAFSGRPGSGKSTLARAVAETSGATWLRIDSIEQAIRDSGVVTGELDDVGYRVAYAMAADNLRLGRDVVSDCVNPWMLTRDAWRAVGLAAGAQVVEVEVVCSDREEHRRRVETRIVEVAGLIAPDWRAVSTLDYHAWDRERLVVDTAGREVGECVARILAAPS
jgi:predicted kinase